VRFLLFVCILFSTFSVTMFYAVTLQPPQCMPSVPPAVPGPLTQPSARARIVLINEVLPFSRHTWNCSEIGTANQTHNMWVELYNPQNLALALYPMAKFDSGPGTSASYLPFGAAIPAHGFLVVFPEHSAPFSTTETFSFRLLFGTVIIDQVSFPPTLGTDQSYARIPDGSPNWQITSTPTIDTSNTLISVTATPTHAPKHPSTKGSGTGSTRQKGTSKSVAGNTSTATNNTTRQSVTASGTQPAWSNLQLPSGSPSSPEATTSVDTSANSTTTPPATNDTTDLPRKVLFTSLAIVLASVLFLCWRRFKPT
jgi:hypothetical protein